RVPRPRPLLYTSLVNGLRRSLSERTARQLSHLRPRVERRRGSDSLYRSSLRSVTGPVEGTSLSGLSTSFVRLGFEALPRILLAILGGHEGGGVHRRDGADGIRVAGE